MKPTELDRMVLTGVKAMAERRGLNVTITHTDYDDMRAALSAVLREHVGPLLMGVGYDAFNEGWQYEGQQIGRA